MTVTPEVAAFLRTYVDAVEGVDETRFHEAFYFGDSMELADALAELVLKGIKRGTATSVWSIEADGERLPTPGDLSVVTSWSGKPLCIIETVAVEVVPFSEVSAEFAAIEGEGDGSLHLWQEAHRDYFNRECANAGRQFTESMLVACEEFRVVYQASGSVA